MSSTGRSDYWPSGYFADLAALHNEGEVAGDTHSALIGMAERAATEITLSAIQNPRAALAAEQSDRAAFESRLQARWGFALDLAELVVQESLGAGRWVDSVLRSVDDAQVDMKLEALIRLHGKAAMTSQEVLVLLRSGYSSGALSRWRTLHEVWVVFALLAEAESELSERYLAHDAIESFKAEEDYEGTWEVLGHEAPDWSAADRDESRAALRERFGAAFLRDYGWAAPLFDGKAPKYGQLQEKARLDHWRGYYRMASHGTHANPKGVSWNVQAMANTEALWAGPSNAGLVDPAQCMLIALSNVTVGLLAYSPGRMPEGEQAAFQQSLALVRQQAVLLLSSRAIDELAEVHARQEEEVKEIEDLVERIAEVLQLRPSLGTAELAAALQEEEWKVSEALGSEGARRRLVAVTNYRLIESQADSPPEE